MIIDMQQALVPGDMRDEECGLCRRDFRVESIMVTALIDGERYEIGKLCRECVEHFGRVDPGIFPTIEEYEAFLKRYPEPIWPTGDAMGRAEDEDTFDAAYEASWVWRAPA